MFSQINQSTKLPCMYYFKFWLATVTFYFQGVTAAIVQGGDTSSHVCTTSGASRGGTYRRYRGMKCFYKKFYIAEDEQKESARSVCTWGVLRARVNTSTLLLLASAWQRAWPAPLLVGELLLWSGLEGKKISAWHCLSFHKLSIFEPKILRSLFIKYQRHKVALNVFTPGRITIRKLLDKAELFAEAPYLLRWSL